jgi:1-acyl-sn-glycerol-3-phosphate acyltransferase
MQKILSRIKAIFIAIEFTISILFMILFIYISPKNSRKIRFYWAKLQLFCMGVDLEIKGEIDKSAKMFIFNHQSLLDIVIFEALNVDIDTCWIAKKEIENTPFFGHILKAPKMISVERENKRSLIKLLKDTKDRINNNRVICMFPEGTRKGKGTKVLKFKGGAKLLSDKLNLKTQPIVIVNSINIVDSVGFTASSGKVVLNFMDTIDKDNLDDNIDWYEQTQESMSKILKDELDIINSNR